MSKTTTIKALHEAIAKGETTFLNQVNYHLNQIEKNKDLNAFVNVFAHDAIVKANELDEKVKNKKKIGRLSGVVVSIKDNICYANHTTTAGSLILEGYKSPFSATAVQKLIDEDAIIIGTTNCDQFGMGSSSVNSHYGPVKNAIGENLISGGSSGGAAVSVQSDQCMIALGSDTGGSVRQPAAFTNTIGFKPSYGAVSRYGLMAYGSSFDQIGIIGHSNDDVALIFDVIHGRDEMDSTSIQVTPKEQNNRETHHSKLKLAYIPAMFEGDGNLMNSNRSALEALKQNHDLVPFEFDLMQYLVPCYYILSTAEASSNLSRFDGVRYGYRSKETPDLESLYVNSRSEGFGSEVKKRIMLGTFVLSEGYFDAYFTKALKVRNMILQRINDVLIDVDGLILPVSPSKPWSLDEKITDPIQIYMSDIYTVLANLVGNPCITIPFEDQSDISPIKTSLQLMTKHSSDIAIFNLASSLVKVF